MTHNEYTAYKNNTGMVRKTRQIVMLYEGVIKFVQHAKEAIENDDIELRYNSITKACDIINGLQLSLDFDNGEEIAKLLYDYYAGLDSRLSSVHFSNDIKICEACIDQLKIMRDAWEEIDQGQDDQDDTDEKKHNILPDLQDISENLTNIASQNTNINNSVSLNC